MPAMIPEKTTESAWNVVVTIAENAFRDAHRLLSRWGRVMRTSFYNVLAVQVKDPHLFLTEFAAAVANAPHLLNIISRVVPAHHTFHFLTREEFEQKVRDIVLKWLPELAGTSFHVRIRRRGGKKVLSPRTTERFLDGMLLRALEAQGTPGRINFDDPDRIIQIETINDRAGVSLWSREHRLNYPFLGID